MLKWNHENSQGETMNLLNEFVLEILQPCLIWKAGRDFAAIRAMTTQALLSIGDACPNEAYEIFPKLAKHFSSLSEDDLAITKAYAIRCILKSGPFSFENYNQLAKGYQLLIQLQLKSIEMTFYLLHTFRPFE